MPTFTERFIVLVPRERLYRQLVRVERLAEASDRIQAVQRLDRRPPGVGASWRVAGDFGPFGGDFILTLTEAEPPKRLVWLSQARGWRSEFALELEHVAHGATRATASWTLAPIGLIARISAPAVAALEPRIETGFRKAMKRARRRLAAEY